MTSPPPPPPPDPDCQPASTILSSICVFCGSRPGHDPVFAEAAQATGRLLARQGRRIVYGGGHVGMMGILADAALAEGGIVFGVIPEALQARELGHRGITELRIVSSMHERKALMAQQSQAFMALPGGVGTYEEILEAATWSLLGIQEKPLGLLNVKGFFDPLIEQLDTAARHGFMLPEERAIILDATTPEDLIRKLAAYQRTCPPKWMDISQT